MICTASPHFPAKLFATLIVVVATSMVHAAASDFALPLGGHALGQQVLAAPPDPAPVQTPGPRVYTHHAHADPTQKDPLPASAHTLGTAGEVQTTAAGQPFPGSQDATVSNDFISSALELSSLLTWSTPGKPAAPDARAATAERVDYGAPPPPILSFGGSKQQAPQDTTETQPSLRGTSASPAHDSGTGGAMGGPHEDSSRIVAALSVSQSPLSLASFKSSLQSSRVSNVEPTPAAGLGSSAESATAAALESGGAGTKRFSGLKTTGLVILGGALMGILI